MGRRGGDRRERSRSLRTGQANGNGNGNGNGKTPPPPPPPLPFSSSRTAPAPAPGAKPRTNSVGLPGSSARPWPPGAIRGTGGASNNFQQQCSSANNNSTLQTLGQQQSCPGPSQAALSFVASLAAKAESGKCVAPSSGSEGLLPSSASWNRLVRAEPPTVQAWIAERAMNLDTLNAASSGGKAWRAFRGATMPESTLCREADGEPPIPGLRLLPGPFAFISSSSETSGAPSKGAGPNCSSPSSTKEGGGSRGLRPSCLDPPKAEQLETTTTLPTTTTATTAMNSTKESASMSMSMSMSMSTATNTEATCAEEEESRPGQPTSEMLEDTNVAASHGLDEFLNEASDEEDGGTANLEDGELDPADVEWN